MNNPIILILITLFITFLVGGVLYIIGFKLSGRSNRSSRLGLTAFACGEDFPARRLQINIHNSFLYLTFFMIFDILAFLLALSYEFKGYVPILFCILIFLNITMLLPLWRTTSHGSD